MLAHDQVVHVVRATEDDARGIAALHAQAERATLDLARGHAVTRALSWEPDERVWRGTLRVTSGDRRPWVAWRGDRAVGFVTCGPSRDVDAGLSVGELYVLDVDAREHDAPASLALVDHACRDLASHGFAEVTCWVAARDDGIQELLRAAGWHQDRSRRFERLHGVPVLEFRYRKSLSSEGVVR